MSSRSDGSTADYYILPEAATQLQDLISHRDMNSQIGEIFRACYRYGIVSHSDKMRDAKKIRFYAQAEVERLEKLEQAVARGRTLEECANLLYEQPSHIISDIPDVSDCQDWKAGDIVESSEESLDIGYGCHYELVRDPDENGDISFIDSAGDYRTRDGDKYTFVSRPARTAQ